MSERQELRTAAEARLGTLVGGRFRLDRILGLGGMAVVYEATHRNGKRVALKLLHASLGTSERHRKRFLREAYAANAIAHRGVVQIHDDGEDPDAGAYLVMELLEGESVGTLQRRHGGRLDLARVQRIGDQLLDVLSAAHARGVIHRDIKPDNLFITREGELKVLDFGIAHLFEHVPGSTFETQPGSMLGTPAFMPQEQARGRWDEVDARSDLWAVGATLFSLISGEHVHMADTSNEQLGRAMTVPARSLQQARADLPKEFVAVIDRALRFERSERWPDARSMQDALREASTTPRADRTSDWDQLSTLDQTLSAVSDLSRPSSPATTQARGPLSRTAALVFLALVSAMGVAWAALHMASTTPEATLAAPPTAPTVRATQPHAAAPVHKTTARDASMLTGQAAQATAVPRSPAQDAEPVDVQKAATPAAPKTRVRAQPRGPVARPVAPAATTITAATSGHDPLDQRR